MFRLAKILFLVAVVGLLVGLAVLDQSAPVLYAQTLRQGLQAESLALRSLILKQRQLNEWRRVRWVRLVAHEPDLRLFLSRPAPAESAPTPVSPGSDAVEEDGEAPGSTETSAAAPIPPETPAPELDASLDAILDRAAREATRQNGWSPDFVVLVAADGQIMASIDPAGTLENPGRRAAVDDVRSPSRAGTGLHIVGERIDLTTYAPVEDRRGRVAAAVVAGEPLDPAAFDLSSSEKVAGLAFFGDDGRLVASTFREGEARRAARQHVASLIRQDAFPRGSDPLDRERAARPDDSARVAFDHTGDRLLALVSGRLRGVAGEGTEPPIAFVLVLDAGEVPGNLASLVLRRPELLPSPARIWLTVVLGLVLLSVGIVLFEFEGRRYRRAISFLEYQLARQALQRDDSAGNETAGASPNRDEPKPKGGG